MSEQKQDEYFPSAGIMYALVGVPLLILGGLALANWNESDTFGVLGLLLGGSGVYCIVTGAVARGIQLARR